jgi:hypothetical protein
MRKRPHILQNSTLLSGILAFITTALPISADQLSLPSSLTDAFKNGAGVVLIQVRFDHAGKVDECHIVRSTAPWPLEVSTVEFVKKNWNNSFFADQTATLPITYDTPALGKSYWNGDMVPPLNLLSVGDTERDLKLRVTFGSDGWVKDAQVAQSSGSDAIDTQTAMWVKVHWHHAAYANRVMDAPFKFQPPAPKVSIKHEPEHVAPPAPPEPIAPPAVRVE